MMIRAPLLVAVLFSTGVSAVAQKDTITWTDGTKTSGVVVSSFNLREITYKARGTEERRSSDRVAALEVEKVKDRYRRAFSASREEQPGTFRAIADELKTSDPFLAQFGYREAAELYLDNQQYAEGFGVLEELAQACPDSGFLPMLFREKLEYYLAADKKGDFAKVADAYSNATQVQGYPEGFGVEAGYYKALARGLQGELDEGQLRKEMTQILSRADTNYPDVASRARLQVASSQRREGKFDEARAEFEKIVANPKSAPAVRASAWLGLGHVHTARADANNKEPFREALLAFLRVYLDEQAPEALKAEALYFGSQSAANWGKEGSSFMTRLLKGRLRSQYPDSEWATK